jgi:hypothetical protein
MGMPEATADCVGEGEQGEAGGAGAGALALGAAFLFWVTFVGGAFLLVPFLDAGAIGQQKDGDIGNNPGALTMRGAVGVRSSWMRSSWQVEHRSEEAQI